MFAEGKDDIILEGELMKFKPGLTVNFIPRYVQISKRAFRYFKNKTESFAGKPIVCFRKSIIKQAAPYKVNKASYLKKGSAVTKSGKENVLFDNMFEIELNEDYEDNFQYRDLDIARKALRDREKFAQEELEKHIAQTNIRKMHNSTNNLSKSVMVENLERSMRTDAAPFNINLNASLVDPQ